MIDDNKIYASKLQFIPGAAYISNFILYSEDGGYFDVGVDKKPLLHLWSLGVEEQFYIIFPLFLSLIYKCKINLLLCLIAFTVVSFTLNVYDVYTGYASKSFFMPYTRFWELSAGALLAYLNCFTKTTADSRVLIKSANFISIAGFLVLALGFLVLKNSAHNFPGIKAILPIAGSVLIIAAGPNAIFNKYILSHKVLVFLGLISYLLYLWHWPLLSVCNIIEAGLPCSCYIESDQKKPSVAIMGDSHSSHLLPGMYNLINRSYNIKFFGISAHVPYYGFKSLTIRADKLSSEIRTKGAILWDRAFMDELLDPNTKVFVLAHRPWCSRNDITDTKNPNSTFSSEELHLIGAKRTFDLLKQFNKQVIIVKDNPQLPFASQKCQQRPIAFRESICSFDREIFDKDGARNFYNTTIEKVAKDYDNINFIDLSDKLCDDSKCYIKIEGKVVYSDNNHLNKFGSSYVASILDEVIRKALKN